jgi:hypothetical protein
MLASILLSVVVWSPASGAPVEVNGGFGHGVTVASGDDVAGDEAFAVTARLRLQLRGAVTVDDDDDDPDARLRPELLVRRARIALSGHLLEHRFEWKVQLGLSQNDVEADLPIIVRDANVTWNATPAIGVRVGQMKVPFDRQRLTSSSALQFAERSRVVNELNLDRDIGLVVVTRPFGEQLNLQAGLFGGDGRNRPIPKAGLLWAARAQWTPLGDFDDLEEGDLGRTADPKVAFAVAAALNAQSIRARSTHGGVLAVDGSEGALDYAHGSADVLFKWLGYSLLVQGLARQALDDGEAPVAVARSGAGLLLQGGVVVVDGLELVGRVGLLVPLHTDAAPDNAIDLVREWESTLGANLCVLGHDLKLQLDGGFVGTDLERPDLVARSQLQLYF